MSPTIRVDEEVFKALQRRAQPFVDSPNDVIRRLVGLNHSRRRTMRRSRALTGSVTLQRLYRPLILQALAKAGGGATMQDVLAAIKREMDGRFKARDLEQTSTGAVVWENKAQWERFNMVKAGLLKPDSIRGIWELSEKGWQEVRKQQ